MRKVGIMGGTFNPIHNGHLMLAKEAFRQFSLDEILFMPCGNAYMKADQKVESGQTRADMTALAINGEPHFTLSKMEIMQPGNTYTYQTLERLKEENPNVEYYFIVGADSLFHMPKWVNPERIFANCHVLAAIRGDKTYSDLNEQIEFLKQKYAADVRILNIECMNISSSNIRHKIASGESIENDVPEAVRLYIEERGLYR